MLQKVICIDDDPIALLLSKIVISKANFASEIITLSNGQEAIFYLEKEEVLNNHKNSNEPLLLFLDLNMPVMDGWEFLEQFSSMRFEAYKNTKVILLSSSIDPSDFQKSKQFEIVIDFFPKPLTREILGHILQKIKT